ncbi:MAG: ATP-binding protein [Ferrimicrobium sp.]
MSRNPFKATFGSTPPLLVGRDDLIARFATGINNGPGAGARATIYTGDRGVGKTVLLNRIEADARERGWLVISETATQGFITRLATKHLPRILANISAEGKKTRFTGVTLPLGFGGATWESANTSQPYQDFRYQLESVTDILVEYGTGLLITIDEIHYKAPDELREFGVTLQHAFRENREVAFAGAGLPTAVSALLNDDVLTFLQRADQHVLGAVELVEVERAIREPIEANGRRIEPTALKEAATATGGYPFLIQLIGQHIWDENPQNGTVTSSDVEAGAAAARKRVGSLIYGPAITGASDVARTFLVAMAQDDGSSKMADICARLGVSPGYGSQYRLQLLKRDLIESPRHGEVDFVSPYLREYLREHAVTSALRFGNPPLRDQPSPAPDSADETARSGQRKDGTFHL